MGPKVLDTFLQILPHFVLVTVVGGIFTFWFQRIRDNAIRQDSQLQSIRDLIIEVDKLYRTSKQVKRMIRSRVRADPDSEYFGTVDQVFFEGRMDQLSEVQLELEHCGQVIRARIDLFQRPKTKRICNEIEYAESYFHDVIEEFEKQKVACKSGVYCLPKACTMLRDFVGPRQLPDDVRSDFKEMEKGASIEIRYAAWQRILEGLRNGQISGEDNRRFKPIADECLLLALREMREAILERLNAQGAFYRLVQRIPWPAARS